MHEGKRVIGVITARGGSRGLPRKNILPLAGKPLISWTIQAARHSATVDRVLLSTDDEEIAHVARAAGCDVPFLRPAELARDDTPGEAPLLHVLDQVEGFDYAVLLQPTSPLRTAQDIDACVRLCIDSGAASACSVCEADNHPAWCFEIKSGKLSAWAGEQNIPSRRQLLSSVYSLNGAVYVVDVDRFRQTRKLIDDQTIAHVMPRSRSVDIDTAFDLKLCEFLLESNTDD